MSAWEGIDEFVAVVEHGGFTAAAAALRVSSSHISRQVARLEERLRARLLVRTTRRVAMTDEGRDFLAHCQRIIAARDAAFGEIGERDDTPSGFLRMTCATAFGERFIMPLINEVMVRHPRLSVEVELTNRVIDLTHEGFDLAIRLGRLSESSLVATRLAPRVMYLVASPDFLATHGTPRGPEDLGGQRCLIGSSTGWLFTVNGEDWPFRPRGRWRCNSGEAVLDAALRGLGIGQLPDYQVEAHIAAGRLVSLLENLRPTNTAVWALHPLRGQVAPKVRHVIAHLRAGLASPAADADADADPMPPNPAVNVKV